MSKFLKSFYYAFKGLKFVWREEINFRIQLAVALLVIAAMIFFRFSFVETSIVIIAIIIVLITEIINTALEDLCNKIEPNQDAVIGKIKDMMAAFVLISVVGALIIGILTFFHHFFPSVLAF